MAGKILLRHFQSSFSRNQHSVNSSTLAHLIMALRDHPDKTTRIYAAECLWVLSFGSQGLPKDIMEGLKPFLDESQAVNDIKVLCRAAYCQALERFIDSRGEQAFLHEFRNLVTPYDLSWLVGQYAVVDKLVLDSEDYSQYVNRPILKVLKIFASIITFTDDIYRLLTFLLTSASRDQQLPIEHVLEIFQKQIQQISSSSLPSNKGQRSSSAPFLPHYCQLAIENLFLSVDEPKLYEISLNLILQICRDLHQLLSDKVVEELYGNLQTATSSSIQDLGFLTLLYIHCNQDLAGHIFRGLDLEFATSRLLIHIQSKQKRNLDLVSKSSAFGRSLQKFNELQGGDKTVSGWRSQLLETISNYISRGQRVSAKSLSVLEQCLLDYVEPVTALECLTYASENGQDLSAKIIKTAFTFNTSSANSNKTEKRSFNKILPKLALALVHNNQSLDDSFLNDTTSNFCTEMTYPIIFSSDDEVSHKALAILTKLVQNNQPFKELPQVIQKFCECWDASQGGSHYQRLEILQALVSFVNSGRERENFEISSNLKEVFVDALKSNNPQFLETGLYGLIALNSTRPHLTKPSLPFCNNEDFKLLVQIQRRSSSSTSVKKTIQEFLSNHQKLVPQSLRASLNLSNLEDKSHPDFLADLGMLLKLQDFDFFQSQPCQSRIANLLETSQDEAVIIKALKIIKNYPYIDQLSMTTFEAVAFAMVNNITEQSKSNPESEVHELCRQILTRAIESSVKMSKAVYNYLNIDVQHNLQPDSGPGTETTLEFQELLQKSESNDHNFDKKDTVGFEKLIKHGLQKIPKNFLNIRHLVGSPPTSFSNASKTMSNLIAEHISSLDALDLLPLAEKSKIFLQKVIEETDQDLKQIVLESFTKVLQQPTQFASDDAISLQHLVTSLTNQYENEAAFGKKIAILKTLDQVFRIQITVQDQNESEEKMQQNCPFIPFSAVEQLVEKVSDPSLDPVQRKLIFNALSQLPIDNIIIEDKINTKKNSTEKDGSSIMTSSMKKIGSLFNKMSTKKKSKKEKLQDQNQKDVLDPESEDKLNEESDLSTKIEEFRKLQQQFQDYLESLTLDVFQIIFDGDKEIAKRELEMDPTFTKNFVQFLQVLSYWDLKSLHRVNENRSKWFQTIHDSDFLSTFVTSKSHQFEIQQNLDQLYSIIPAEISGSKKEADFLELINQRCREIPNSSISSFLDVLTSLGYDFSIKILEHPKFAVQWLQLTQESLLIKLLIEKFSFKVNPLLLENLVQQLISTCTPDLAIFIIDSISEIYSIHTTEIFCQIVEDNHLTEENLKDLYQNAKLLLKSSSHTAKEVQVVLETQILMSQLPQNVPRRARIERIIKTLLTNDVAAEDLRSLIDMTKVKNKVKAKGQTSDADRSFTIHKSFEHIIFQSSQYKVSKSLFHDIVSCLRSTFEEKKSNLENFIPLCNQKLSEGIFDGKKGVKDLGQIISEFQLNNSKTSFKWSSLKARFVKAGYQWEVLKLKILQVKDCDKKSRILDEPEEDTEEQMAVQLICNWDEQKVKLWADKVKEIFRSDNSLGQLEMSENEFYLEALMVARRAIKLRRNFHLTDIQILSCLVALQKLDKDKHKGQLQQVATGSGKSAIIAVLSTIKALFNNQKVDVYTSPVLAERDSKEWSKFYEMFGLTCGHNADKSGDYISGPKSCYRRDIVYGDCSQFQFDFLRDKYSDLKTMAGRECQYAIIDEVDNMFLDDSSKLARLSSTLPGMDLLEILYHFIWDRLSYLKEHLFSVGTDQMYYIEGKMRPNKEFPITSYDFVDPQTKEIKKIEDLLVYIVAGKDLDAVGVHKIETSLEQFVIDHLTNYSRELIGHPPKPDPAKSKSKNQQDTLKDDPPKESKVKVKLPNYLQEFALSQIPKWVDSALTALMYQENVHYIIDQDQIKPVDYLTTGIVQGNTNWNNGLHQFLGLKHSLRIQPETVTTNYLSNAAMFQKYGPNILGFTGTLGSPAGRSVLYNIYKVNQLVLPETNFKRYRQFPDIVVYNDEDWLREILISTLEESSKGRAVLIICETIQKADYVSQALSKFPVKVKVYTKNEEEGESEKQIERAHPGDVIVATNLAGRGTDIKTIEIEPAGGLHVVLSFLPQSQRIDEQAFGRTSRQGNKGTGQLIIVQQNQDDQKYKEQRDLQEKQMLEAFQNVEYPKILMKDELFERFRKFVHTIRNQLKEERLLFSENVKKKSDSSIVTDFKQVINSHHAVLQSSWLFVKSGVNKVTEKLFDKTWLDEDTVLSPYEQTVLQSFEEIWAIFLRAIDDGDISLEDAYNEYQKFEDAMAEKMKEGSLDLLKAVENLYYFIQLGNYEYFSGNTKRAVEYFDQAVKMDEESTFSAGAFVGQACCLLKDSSSEGYKEKAMALYRSSLPLLYEEMSIITVKQTMVQKHLKNNQNVDTPLMQQLTEKSNLLGMFINTVSMNMETIEKSLRRVRCTGIKKNNNRISETYVIPTEVIRGDRGIKLKDFDEYKLTFSDLTLSHDSGEIDQAIVTLGLMGGKQKKSRLSRAANAVSDRFSPFGKLTEYMSSVKFEVNLVCPGGDLKTLIEGKQKNGTSDPSDDAKNKSNENQETSSSETDSDLEDAPAGFFSNFVAGAQDLVTLGVATVVDNAQHYGGKAKTAYDQSMAYIAPDNFSILEKDLNLHLEISGFDLDIDLDLEGNQDHQSPAISSHLPLAFEKMESTVTSYSLKIETTSNQLDLLTRSPDCDLWKTLDQLNHVQVEVHSADENKDPNANSAEQTSYSSILPRGQAKGHVNGKNLTSLKFLNCKSPVEVNKIIESIKQSLTALNKTKTGEPKGQGPILISATLVLCDLEKNREKLVKDYMEVFGRFKNKTTIYISDMSNSTAQAVIPWMRRLSMEFRMEVTKLSLKSAEILLQNASLTQEKMQQSKIQEFSRLYLKNCIPLTEIQMLKARGIFILVTFNEKQPLPYFSIICVCALATVQVTVGGFLIASGFGASVGMSLVTEGFSDFNAVYRICSSRQFSWSDYAKQKAVSLIITAVSLGMSNLKDGVKGAADVVSAGAKEVAEQAATRAATTTIQTTGKVLTKQAFKHIGVAAVETTGRIALKAFTDHITGFCFDKLRDNISSEVAVQTQAGLLNDRFFHILSGHWALENYGQPPGKIKMAGVQQRIDRLVESTLSPTSDFWRRQWESVGSPLATGILADPKFVGSGFNTAMLVWGSVSGVQEIRNVIPRVCGVIVTGLKDEFVFIPQVISLLQSQGHLSMNTAEILRSKVKVNFNSKSKAKGDSSDYFTIDLSDINLDPKEKTKINETLKKLNDLQKTFDPTKGSTKTDLSLVTRSVVNLVTSHVIKIADSHLVSPVMSKIGGQIVAKISAELQDRFLVDKTEEEYVKMKKKVDDLKKEDPSKLTDADRAYLQQYDRKMTVASQTNMVAKAYMVAYRQRERIQVIVNTPDQPKSTKTEEGQRSTSGSTVKESVKQVVNGVLNGGPANDAEMMQAAKDNGLEIVLTSDPGQKLTPEEIARGVKLILREPPPPGDTSGIGHFVLLDENGQKVAISSPGQLPGSVNNNCGYEIIAALADPPKDSKTVRTETALSILENPEKFEKIAEIGQWFEERYPQEASQFMFVAGRQARRHPQYIFEQEIPEDKLASNDPEYDPLAQRPIFENSPIMSGPEAAARGGAGVEFIEAVILAKHIRTGTAASDASRELVRQLGEAGDHAGHLIANILGGDGDLHFNIIPQNNAVNTGQWRVEEDRIRQFVEGQPNNVAHLRIEVVYGPESRTRPTEFIVHSVLSTYNEATNSYEIQKERQIRVLNPPSAPPRPRSRSRERNPNPAARRRSSREREAHTN